jgi:hypothetical protein
MASSGAARDLTGDLEALQSMHLHSEHRPARRMRLLVGAVCLSALATLAGCSKAATGPIVTVHTASGDSDVAVELALTRESQARGLMYRTELAEGAGMLFVFDDEAERQFWMSNTPIPLDIVYIKGDATIVSIAENTTPYSEKMIPSRGKVRYVLEVPGGWSQRHGAKPGDRLTLPDLVGAKKAGD